MTSQPKHTIRTDGTQEWRLKGLLHRLAGPAWIDADGTKEWWVNNQRHRTDGPAVILANGQQEWWVNGENITAQVLSWQQQQSVTWPWDQATQAQFVLTWG